MCLAGVTYSTLVRELAKGCVHVLNRSYIQGTRVRVSRRSLTKTELHGDSSKGISRRWCTTVRGSAIIEGLERVT